MQLWAVYKPINPEISYMKKPGLILFIICLYTTTYAQLPGMNDGGQARNYWASAGYGAGTFAENLIDLNLTGELKNNWILTGNVQVEMDARKTYAQPGVVELSTYNLLIGKLHHFGNSLFTTSIGLGVVHRNSFDTNSAGATLNEVDENTIGLPINVQGFYLPFKWGGIGLNGYVNLNTLQTIAGVNFSIAIGNMGR